MFTEIISRFGTMDRQLKVLSLDMDVVTESFSKVVYRWMGKWLQGPLASLKVAKAPSKADYYRLAVRIPAVKSPLYLMKNL